MKIVLTDRDRELVRENLLKILTPFFKIVADRKQLLLN